VRIAAIETIVLSERTLPDVVNRIKDVKPSVRLAAISRLHDDNVDPRHLSRGLKVTLIQYGLQDRDDHVQTEAKTLFLKWITVLHYNIPKLLMQLGLDSTEAEQLAKVVLTESDNRTDVNVDLRRAIREQRLDWTTSFQSCAVGELFWTLMRCEYYHHKVLSGTGAVSITASELIEALLPDTLQLCQLMREALSSITEQDQQAQAQIQLKILLLLRLATYCDQGDEAGRVGLTNVCREMLTLVRLPERLVASVLSVWLRCGSGETTNMISDVLELIRRLWADADVLEAENTFSHRAVDTDTDSEGEEEEEDMVFTTRLRAIELAVWLVQQALGAEEEVRQSVFSLRTLVDSAIQQPVPELRAEAMHCLGLLGILQCEDMAAQMRRSTDAVVESDLYEYSRQIALQTVSLEDEEVCTRSQALQTLADMALVRPDSATEDSSLVNLLLHILEGEDPDLVCTAAEAAAKLLFNGVLTDSRLFCKLLIIFFQPDLIGLDQDEQEEEAEEERRTLHQSGRLQQLLNVFFKAFFRAGGKRDQVLLSATVELASELSSMVREGEAEVTVLNQIIDHIMHLCGNMVTFTTESGELEVVDAKVHELEDAPTQARRAIKLRAILAILRELLKLGSGVVDRALAKELLKMLCWMADMPTDWITGTVAAPLSRIISCVYRRFSSDRAVAKVLERLRDTCDSLTSTEETSQDPVSPLTEHDSSPSEESCRQSSLSSSQSGALAHPLFSIVPGLMDLVELSGESEKRRSSSGKKGESLRSKKNKKEASARAEATVLSSPTSASPMPKRSRVGVKCSTQKRSKLPKETSNDVNATLDFDADFKSPFYKRDRLTTATPVRTSARIASSSKTVNYSEDENGSNYSD